jgi:hypothetical protein
MHIGAEWLNRAAGVKIQQLPQAQQGQQQRGGQQAGGTR